MYFPFLAIASLAFLLSSCHAAIEGTPTCAPYDYAIKSATVCSPETGKRSMTYEKYDLDEFPCLGPDSITLDHQDCECDLYEYQPVFAVDGRCINNRRMVKGWNQTDSQCAANPTAVAQLNSMLDPATSWIPCPCTEDDIGSKYTDCNDGTDTRTVIFFWERLCVPGGLVLPRPSLIGCRDECDDGQYLGPPNTMCENCSSGTYSAVADVYSAPWASLPSNFHTACTGLGCRNWRVFNNVLESGDQNANNYATAQLTFWADVKTSPSYMKVTFRTSSEASDYFAVSLNGVRVAVRSGIMPDWTTLSIDLQETGRNCKWQVSVPADASGNVSGLCMIRNVFDPWTENIHYNASLSPYMLRGAVAANIGCNATDYGPECAGRLVLVRRDGHLCRFDHKVMLAQAAGAAAVLVVDHMVSEWMGAFHMAGDSTNMTIPSMSIGRNDGERIITAIQTDPNTYIKIEAEDVDIGLQEIMFEYVKDYSGTEGDDKVYVKDITVTGTKYAAEECTDCPPGQTSTEQSTQCVPCPVNSYAAGYGTRWPCHPCPLHSSSAPGSSKCTPNDVCGPDDYYVRYGACTLDAGSDPATYTQLREYVTVDPPTCNLANSTFVTDNTSVPCGPCARGSVRDHDPTKTVHHCRQCPQGHIPSSTSECVACPLGSIARRTLRYDGFGDLEGVIPATWLMPNYCHGCVGNGWSLIPADDASSKTYLATGRTVGEHGGAVLIIPIVIEVEGDFSIKVDYAFDFDAQFPGDLQSIGVLFTVQSVSSKTSQWQRLNDNDITPNKTKQAVVYFLSPGHYTMTFYYNKWSATDKPVTFIIQGLSVFGEASGGASTCETCPRGYQCKNYEATPCGPGTYSDGLTASQCTKCYGNTVAVSEAAMGCTQCATGTIADADTHAVCYLEKNPFMVLSEGRDRYLSFNMSFLSHRIGPISTVINNTGSSDMSMYIHLRTGIDQNEYPWAPRLPCSDIIGPYVCLYSNVDNNTFSMGTTIASMRTEWRDAKRDDVVIEITGGDRCTERQDEPYRATLRLVCSDTVKYIYRAFDGCHATVEIHSPEACPTCTSVGSTEVAGMCGDDGRRLVTEFANMTCATYVTSPFRYETCTFLDTAIQKHQTAIGLIVAGSVILLIALGVIVAYLYVSRRKIYSQYQQLSRGQANEMGILSPEGLELEDADVNDAMET